METDATVLVRLATEERHIHLEREYLNLLYLGANGKHLNVKYSLIQSFFFCRC